MEKQDVERIRLEVGSHPDAIMALHITGSNKQSLAVLLVFPRM